jgi:uncharacterized membrane protein
MRFSWRREWLPLLVIGLAFVATGVFYRRLPDPMPVHWDAWGRPDNYASRAFGAFLMPAAALMAYVSLFLLAWIDPRRRNIARFEGTYHLLRTGVAMFAVFMQGVILAALLRGGEVLDVSYLVAGLGVLMVVVGNVLPRVRSNWFMGIRTPWTLSSDRVWRDTHRFGGRAWVLCGLVAVVISMWAPRGYLLGLLGVLFLAGLAPVVYSFFAYREEQRRRGS